MKQRKVRSLAASALAIVIASPALSQTETETIRVEVPLLGDGTLVVLSADNERVELVNLNNAYEQDGIMYFDYHIRQKNPPEIFGDPPQIELIYRLELDCKRLAKRFLSVTSQNFHTLQSAQPFESHDNNFNTVDRNSLWGEVCSRINAREGFYSVLGSNHYYGLAKLPAFAMSYRDAISIDERDEEGTITRVSHSPLMLYLKDNNPNF